MTRELGHLEQLYQDRRERDRSNPLGDGWYEIGGEAYKFSLDLAEHFIDFFRTYCYHYKGEWAGQVFVPEPWQEEVHGEIFGWVHRVEGEMVRRFRTAYIEIPRKNGKSFKAAATGNYLLWADEEPGAEVYSTATKKDQARIVFDAARAMVKRSADLRQEVKTLAGRMVVEATDSFFAPLGADSNTLDGLNAHGNIIDELHAHRDRKVWDVMITSMGSRRQPLTYAITTAGTYDPESIGWEQHRYAERVLEQVIKDETFFAYVACADKEDDWREESTWRKANPNYGISVKPGYLRTEAKRAENEPSYVNTFLRLHLNRWTQQVTRWISMDDWNKGSEPFNPRDLYGRKCFGGLDLSSKLDITALLLLFPPEETGGDWFMVPRFWIPEERADIRSQTDGVPYLDWIRDGYVHATPGNVIDYDWIEAEAKALAGLYDMPECAFDPWNAQQTANHMADDGLTMVEVRQGFQSLSEPSKEFERLIVAGQLRHNDNPVMRWMVNNLAIREDPAGNIKPDKEKSSEKIDGPVAAIMALSRAVVAVEEPDPYADGLLVLG